MPPETNSKPRVGIPYRTRKEELKSERESYEKYLTAASAAGAQPVEISLGLTPNQLAEEIRDLDAFMLPPAMSKAALRDCQWNRYDQSRRINSSGNLPSAHL